MTLIGQFNIIAEKANGLHCYGLGQTTIDRID